VEVGGNKKKDNLEVLIETKGEKEKLFHGRTNTTSWDSGTGT